ncbi:hypothetical protein CAEBREN_02225 [Caenorhabditis brenneri]|uniref:BRCT domain-containing protein n=1 Tax=Caenorhabditis brenneri TaxID=135651 RepID=G0MGM6_CAEBE|nr:hypothetical protein CAEBREN_02225 [Caenorhabditis brenneri]
MRFHFIVIIFLWTIVCVGRAKDESDLEIVYDKLAIVARVTNAISLQAAAIKKSVKVRDVIVELLKVNSDHFNIVMDYKPEVLTSTMEELFAETTKVASFNMKTLDPVKELLVLLQNAIQSSAGLDKDAKSKFDEFEKYVKGNQFQSSFDACNLTAVVTEGQLFQIGRTTTNQKLRGYVDSLIKCRQCLEKLEFSGYTKHIGLFTSLESLISNKEPLQKKLSDTPASHLAHLKNAYTRIQGITTRKNQESGKMFNDAIKKVSGMLEKNSPVELTLTLGFPGEGDMAMVAEDLDSDWFKKEISRGKSTEVLKKELTGFFKFGDHMKELEKDWESFGNLFKANKQTALDISNLMEKLDGFEDGQNVEKLFQDSGDTLGKCQISTSNVQSLKDNEKNLLKLVDSLVKSVENTKRHINSINSANSKILEDVAKKLKEDVSLDTLEKLDSKSAGSGSFKTIISSFGEINTEVDRSVETISSLQAKDIKETLSIAMDSVNDLKSYLTCLQGKGFNSTRLLNIHSFIGNAVEMSDSKLNRKIQTVLENYITVRNDVLNAEQFVKDIGPAYWKEKNHEGNPILKLKNAQDVVLSLGRGMSVLRNMARALTKKMKDSLIAITKLSDSLNVRIGKFNKNSNVLNFWPKREEYVTKLLDQLNKLDEFAGTVKNEDLLTMRKVLDEATNIKGFPDVFRPIVVQLKGGTLNAQEAMEFINLSVLRTLDLDFASHKGYLPAASLSFDELRSYFDDVFDLKPKKPQQEVEHNYLTATLICIAIFILLVVGVFLIFGLTKSGRKILRRWYFYYFAKEEEFEKRWRYALFMDKQDGKNALLDAAREINATNVLKAVKKGAYINAFNQFGNTALHVATKRGYPEIVDILIKNGADRTYLNARNKTPEQLIPENWRTSQTVQTDVAERFDEVEKVYKKYKNRKFRKRVPEIFPSSSFHIYVDEKADETVTSEFMKKFQAITSNEALPTTTHYIVRTDQEGVLELDSLELLLWILSGVIIVKETWMTDCLKDPKLIEKDEQYLVKNVRYKGVLYDTVIHWSESMAKFSLPYLCGVYVGITIPDCQNLIPLTSIIVTHGGVICSKFPEKSMFNVGSHPYLHAHLGPIFIIHDGKQDVELYRNDPDKMYTLFTEEEFVHFLLKRGINVDVRPDPIPATTEPDD